MSLQPITKVWVMALKDPSATPLIDPAFKELGREILEFCRVASGPEQAAHQFREDIDVPGRLAMITGYRSAAENLKADKEYVKRGYIERMMQFVESKQLVQVEVCTDDLPLDAKELVIEIFECRCENDMECANRDECLSRGSASDKTLAKGKDDVFVSQKGVEMEKGKPTKSVWVTFIGSTQSKPRSIARTSLEWHDEMRLRKISDLE